MSDHDETFLLLQKRGRFLGYGHNHEKWAVGERIVQVSNKNVDPNNQYIWRKALSDVKRALKEAEVVHTNVTRTAPTGQAVVKIGDQQKPVVAPSPLAGLKVDSKTEEIVMRETTKTVELAPHHLHSLLRGCGYEVPDDAQVTFTNEGYVRLRWTVTEETVRK